MFLSIFQEIPAVGAILSWDSWIVVIVVYFFASVICGSICARIAYEGGMSTTVHGFLGAFLGSIGIFAGMLFGFNIYSGLFLGLIGIAITTAIYFGSRDKTIGNVELPPATPQYAPFESTLVQDDAAFGRLAMPNQPPPEEFAQGAYLCPNCNVNVPNSYDICWNCGELLKRQSISRLCPTCHQENPSGAAHCTNCGCSLDGPTFMK